MGNKLLLANARPGSYIDGSWVTEGRTLTSYDPSRAQALADVTMADGSTVTDAVAAAEHAFTMWRRTPPSERAELLFAVADEIDRQQELLAHSITREVGKPLRQSYGDARAAATQFRFYAGAIDKFGGYEIPTPETHMSFTRTEPIGVTAHLSPWNSPFGIPARSLAAALAMGNTCVFKPSEMAPLAAVNLVACMAAAGVPAGTVNLVHGAADVGKALVGDERVRSITFTGSVAVGAELRRSTADRMTRLSLELGGKSPVIICADADVGDAVQSVHSGLIRNAGQTCLCPSRVMVERSRYDEFVEAFVTRVEATTIGDGMDNHEMGPLIDRRRLDAVEGMVADACGYAKPARRGGRPEVADDLGGYFVEPSVFVDVPRGSALDQQEVFGPVLAVYVFEDVDEAIDLANDVEFGLGAGAWTRDLATAVRLSRELEAGSVSVNEYPIRFPHGPHGGYKRSGMGREQGLEGLRNYVEVKKVSFRLG